MKDLPKVPTWRLQWDSNLRPSGRKAPNLPLSHHAPHCHCVVTETISVALLLHPGFGLALPGSIRIGRRTAAHLSLSCEIISQCCSIQSEDLYSAPPRQPTQRLFQPSSGDKDQL